MFNLLLALIYLSFISLGLPDGLLGAAWPGMYPLMDVPISYAGMVSMIISAGTIVSSLMSDRLTHRFGAGKVTAVSVCMTAAALFGFSVSSRFWMLCLIALPYGLGAGGVDAALNNYVALHYESRHMSWLHCMWGLGAATGPYIMGYALGSGAGWNAGYRYVGLIQIALTVVLFVSLPIWKQSGGESEVGDTSKPLTLRETVSLRGAKEVMICFFCYCAAEQTAMLWAGSYLVLKVGLAAEKAASLSGLFAIGITCGRFFCGFLTLKLSDKNMIRLGAAVMLTGALLILFGGWLSLIGICLFGLGCAPVYPCIIHSTPGIFGADKSQAMIGVQMASAYVGTCLAPPLFGLIARHISVGLLSPYLLVISGLMLFMHERLIKK